MKILKAGELPRQTPQLFRGTCQRCRCVIEVQEGDPSLQVTVVNKSSIQAAHVRCPTLCCNQDIELATITLRTEKAP